MIPIVSVILFAASAFILAITKRERLAVKMKALETERKGGFIDLLFLVEKELSSFELETGVLDEVRERLGREKGGK